MSNATVGAITDIHTVAQNPLGSIKNEGGKEYVYLQGIGSTVAGAWVTYDEAGLTALLAANAVGPVAVAMAATVASTYGWYCRKALSVQANVAASSADNSGQLGREGADGVAGDGRAAGDAINGAWARAATTAAATIAVQIEYPFVNDCTGA
jgi:hypothetical protein